MESVFVHLWGLTESKTNDIIKPLVGMRVPTTETNIYQLERIALGARTPMQCVLTLEGKEKYMITLRSILGLMDDFNNVTIVLSKQEIQVFPLFALEFFKDSILDMNVARIEGSKIYVDGGNGND